MCEHSQRAYPTIHTLLSFTGSRLAGKSKKVKPKPKHTDSSRGLTQQQIQNPKMREGGRAGGGREI